MTMDENVKDAAETIDFYFRNAPSGDAQDWQTIRARLVALEAENTDMARRLEAAERDSRRLNRLALHPRGAKIVIDGETKDCIFWGISSAPENTLREAIDTIQDGEETSP